MDPILLGIIIRDLAYPLILVAGGFYVAGKTPIGKSLLGHGEHTRKTAETVRELEARMAELETQLEDAHERLDFSERLLQRRQPTLQDSPAPEQTPV